MWWCLHGALGSYRDWGGLGLPRHVAVDLWQAHPASDMETWAAAWTPTVLERDPAPYLLGYSMGGRLALHVLLAAPEQWRGAVIVSAHPGLRDSRERQARREADAAWLARFRKEPFLDVMHDWNKQPVFAGGGARNPPERFLPAMARCFREWSLGHQDPLWDQLGCIETPVWWLCGEKDSKFAALGREAVSRLPRGHYEEAAQCRHRVPWEWDGFAGFLTSVESTGSVRES